MGDVTPARDLRLGRSLVLKEVKKDVTPLEKILFTARLEQEAQIAASLSHSGIVPVYEAGVWEDGDAFIAMADGGGKTLLDNINQLNAGGGTEQSQSVPAFAVRAKLLRPLMSVVDAVAYAHSKGIIHRDITPRNVLIGDFGEARLIDWGLGRLADSGASVPEPSAFRTRSDILTTIAGVGTSPYCPPEQMRGDAPTKTFDVYSLGATLFHVIAGVPPPADPTALTSDLFPRDCPRPLASIVRRAMCADASRRHADGEILAEELRQFFAGQLVPSHQRTWPEVLRDFLVRHAKALIVGGFLGLLSLVAVLVVRNTELIEEKDKYGQIMTELNGLISGLQSAIEAKNADSTVLRQTLAGIKTKADDLQKQFDEERREKVHALREWARSNQLARDLEGQRNGERERAEKAERSVAEKEEAGKRAADTIATMRQRLRQEEVRRERAEASASVEKARADERASELQRALDAALASEAAEKARAEKAEGTARAEKERADAAERSAAEERDRAASEKERTEAAVKAAEAVAAAEKRRAEAAEQTAVHEKQRADAAEAKLRERGSGAQPSSGAAHDVPPRSATATSGLQGAPAEVDKK